MKLDKAETVFNKLSERRSRLSGASEGALASGAALGGASLISKKLFPGGFKKNLLAGAAIGAGIGALFPGKKRKRRRPQYY